MPPTSQLSILYCNEADVQAILSVDGENLRLTDQGESSPTPTELAYLTVNGINYATSRVNFFAQGRYDATALQQSWMVNEWASIVAARWLCSRRGNGVPASLKEMYDEAMKDMEWVKKGEFQIPDIGSRNVAWLAWSNVIVRPEYIYRKIRVERPLSEQTPVPYFQATDWSSLLYFEI